MVVVVMTMNDGIGRLGVVSTVRQKWHKSLSVQKLGFVWCKAQHNRVPGEIKRWEMELDPHISPEEIMSNANGEGTPRRQDTA